MFVRCAAVVTLKICFALDACLKSLVFVKRYVPILVPGAVQPFLVALIIVPLPAPGAARAV